MKKRDGNRTDRKRMPRRRKVILFIVIILVALAAFFTAFRTENVIVSGNTRYTDEDIKSICLDGAFSNNTFLFTLSNRSIELSDMPYLDHVDSEMIDRHTIHLSVMERIACGRIKYGGKIVYFDKNGNVLEIRERDEDQDKTAVLIEGPEIEQETVSTGDVIFEEEGEMLSELSVLAQLLLQYEMVPDKARIDEENNILLEFGDIRINLGSDTFLEEKVARADAILPDIEGSAGILHLEDYSESAKDIVFETV